MTNRTLNDLPRDYARGQRRGIPSVCSAHPLVVEAALRAALGTGRDVLIEATCNQVNQEGGYTGMKPADFRRFVEEIAAKVGFDTSKLILGGDHLGPNPWKALPAEEALARAEAMIDAYVTAGFTKIHLDTSMGCAGEPVALPDAVTAERAARLAAVAERAADGSGFEAPVYVIGTEVPIPGGAMEALDHLAVTSPEAARETVEVHRRAFHKAGAAAAFERAIGVVVQPGVEFGNENVVVYDRDKARRLSATLDDLSQFVFEAHSTDYQPAEALAGLVEDGFAILKVGPGATFALREALYGLDRIAVALDALRPEDTLEAAMEHLMLAEPGNWARYYPGTPDEQRLQRHFSYSDRIRYYWPHPHAAAAVARLLARLDGRRIPETLISQYLGPLYPAVAAGRLAARPHDLLIAAVQRSLAPYDAACGAM
ncbi:D-tagatose-bisphosphate aldolase, class II, non-catalytic subunit [Segnochrobactrum spirostomi]|uniref:D-tagatose-bisphosphate aldolase, class II, non-catalytic subunit n=1 Tax=Segnochrobactrum spirostomi TaxID=2608987 RepID=A0A6A7Y0E8_9HYPH|nr:D-tagatose-bisphosphate aldolase, class II, non-catalytic subunit [Segnochrobactrum spirostomi]MQT11867.1 D-tagatose-bisphosphate aldolase, class II, non-catalytic subunit [Segnochrobactrum spirostomi]